MPYCNISAGPNTDDWEIPVDNVQRESKFSEGCFGEVYKGVVRGPITNSRMMKNTICVNVAIKMLKRTCNNWQGFPQLEVN